jgi:hypothetical protein
MAQAERLRLRAQRPPRSQPAQRRAGVGHLGHQFVMKAAQADDRRLGMGAAVGEGGADADVGELAGDQRHLGRRRPHDQADLRLDRLHALERMHAEHEARQGGGVVGGHQPRGEAEEQHELDGERD